MKNPHAAAHMVFGAVLTFSGTAQSAESSAQSLVVGQEIAGITAPGLTGVLWTRRQDYYTLQVQFTRPPNPISGDPPMAPGSSTGNPYPDVRVELRDSSGAQIPHVRRYAVTPGLRAQPVARGSADGVGRIEVIYTFHLGDGERAKTIALQINERQFVTGIPRLVAADRRARQAVQCTHSLHRVRAGRRAP